MSSSLILTNSFFFTLGTFLIIYLLDKPMLLTYKKGIPVFALLVLIIVRLIFPYEFHFTKTIPSKTILPFVRQIEQLHIANGLILKELFLVVWFSVSVILLIHTLYKHRQFIKVISLLPCVKDKEVVEMFLSFCKEQNLKKVPKLVRFNNYTSPTIVGFMNPMIIMPSNLSKEEIKFTLLHELEHYKHHHLLLKISVEIAFILYWWHPLTWILKMNVIQALELQADAYVTQNLSDEDTFAYTHTLVNMACRRNKQESAFSMTFATCAGVTKKRMLSLTDGIRLKGTTILLKQKLLIFSSVALLLLSILFTFEASHINPDNVVGSSTMETSKTYFLKIPNGKYEFYIDGNYVSTLSDIPEKFSHFPLYTKQ